jgi:hypothetical protein
MQYDSQAIVIPLFGRRAYMHSHPFLRHSLSFILEILQWNPIKFGTGVYAKPCRVKKSLVFRSVTLMLNKTQTELRLQQNPIYPDADYPDRLGPSGKHFLIVIVLHLFMA